MAADEMDFQMSDEEMFDQLDELSGEFENEDRKSTRLNSSHT